MDYLLYHNPRCSKSRQTLQILEQHGVTVRVINYLQAPPSAAELKSILSLLKMQPRELLRESEDEYHALKLDDPALSSDDLIEAICKHPKLLQRPILVTPHAAIIGRPPEAVLSIIG